MKLAKGYFGAKGRLYRSAKEQVERSLNFAFTGRKVKKRDFRRLWIVRINAACRLNGDLLQPLHGRPEEGRDHASTARSWPTSP